MKAGLALGRKSRGSGKRLVGEWNAVQYNYFLGMMFPPGFRFRSTARDLSKQRRLSKQTIILVATGPPVFQPPYWTCRSLTSSRFVTCGGVWGLPIDGLSGHLDRC